MNQPVCSEFELGRRFVGRLPHGKDLIASVEDFCIESSIQMATFSIIGAVSSATIGAYDQKQQVYVTYTENMPMEIVTCVGNVSLKDQAPVIHAHIVLGDETRKNHRRTPFFRNRSLCRRDGPSRTHRQTFRAGLRPYNGAVSVERATLNMENKINIKML